MKYTEILPIAQEVKSHLAPHCTRIEIAGSIRREKSECGDIEIVCIPKPYETGLFENGIATVINRWEKVKGALPCKYTQRIYQAVKVDIFFAVPENWGYILAIRTGSADFSHKYLAAQWVKRGYQGRDGFLWANGRIVPVLEEIDLFKIIGAPYVEPKNRT